MRRRHLFEAIAAGAGLAIVVSVIVWLSGRDRDSGSRVVAQAGPDWSGLAAIPLTPRGSPAIAWTGSELLVFGGWQDPGGTRQPLSDGATYDTSAGRWSRAKSIPIEPAPYAPVVVWAAGRLVLVGSPCVNRAGPDGEPDCSPGGYAAATYDPDEDSWSSLDLPRELASPRGARPFARAVGEANGFAIFAIWKNFTSHDLTYWAVSPAGEWQRVPEPPFAATDDCVAAGRLVAIAATDQTDAGVSQGPTNGEVPIPDPSTLVGNRRAASYDPATEAWSPAVVPPGPDPAPVFMHVFCLTDSVLTLPSLGSADVSDRYDAVAEEWKSAALAPEPVPPGATVALAGHQLVAIDSQLRSRALRYDATSDTWAVGAAPTARARLGAVSVGDEVLLIDYDKSRRHLFTPYRP